ncbi:glycosyltransferase family 4 protein [Salisediminibacterium beveridgei]|uniref:Glycosyl transferase, group 1 family protein n=1 Tax=Salisediminibacterium beveridgei TaxID=632773 RepID=A0A1D7QRR4_9BACI|nr:glycosyltransferase family 4 protein [Salisediminibacterium beveridgei]AOM81695.1 glycosyl transferase, group 1 family protein [Salisediminibacterium beveridgei]
MKILIAGHDLKFLAFYTAYLETVEQAEVRYDNWEGHNSHDIAGSLEKLKWADIVFCEWGLGNAVFYSEQKRQDQRLIVRLHRQELNTGYLHWVDPQKVDAFICVSPRMRDAFAAQFRIPAGRIRVIPNAVDLNGFTPSKAIGNKTLGMVGYIPKLKRMDKALDILQTLHRAGQEYRLVFKGVHPFDTKWLMKRPDERAYFEEQFDRIEQEGLSEYVSFESFGSMETFYSDKDFILSMSDVEAFHLAVAEGMAAGVMPVICGWRGAEQIYGRDFILSDVEDITAFLQILVEDEDQHQETMKRIVRKFDEKRIIAMMDRLLF